MNEREDLMASCAITSHVTLLVYSLLSKPTFSLYILLFVTGIACILILAGVRITYEDNRYFIGLSVVGVSAFNSSIYLSQVYPVFSVLFKWAISVAFNLGGFRSMKLVDAQKIVRRNIAYCTLNLILNIIYLMV